MADRIIKRIESADRRRAMELQEGLEGLVRFTEFTWVVSKDETDRIVHGEGYWMYGWQSGLYPTAEAAERDAKATLPWLNDSAESKV
jgi:hypothetical protein